jgi:hypothetical protein
MWISLEKDEMNFMTDGPINFQHERPDAFAKLPALAERLGVKPMKKDHPPTWSARTKEGISYDIFDLINAVLDRVDKNNDGLDYLEMET